MRKIIAAINLTLDGYCDHTAIVPDVELHQYYADLLKSCDSILFGRITYELMTYWQTVLNSPTGEEATDDFARTIDNIPKIVFSRSWKNVEWETARIARHSLEEEVLGLKQQVGRDILIGSRSLIMQLMRSHLIDEYQFCVHPVIAGSGLALFENIKERTLLKLLKTRSLGGGAVILYYEPAAL